MGNFFCQPRSKHSEPSKGFESIKDKYETFEQVQDALRNEGLESSNLVIGVDYTKSNQWNGKKSFQGKCLHDIDSTGFLMNPYQSVISSVGRTLEVFDDDKLIPAFGFGDATTKDRACFPFFPDRACNGFDEVLRRYTEITPNVNLAGPTNFAPVIYETIEIVRRSGGFHILVIIADGQVTNEAETRKAIVDASHYPISIVMIGVGDGPWELMEEFDDGLPTRRFDNFQFVECNRIMAMNARNPDVSFALAALMEIPDQFKAIRKLGLL